MTTNENAGGVGPTGVSGDTSTTGDESMATSLTEVNTLPGHHQARALAALDRLRRMIVSALVTLQHESDSPRYIEASLRLSPVYQSITHLEEVKQITVDRDVHDTIQQLDAHWSPSMFEARCEGLRIAPDAYVDLYEERGLLPKLELSSVAKRYVP